MDLDLNAWSPRNGQTRYYLNNWLQVCGYSIARYSTGNVSSAYRGSERFANNRAACLRFVKVWLDEDKTTLHLDHYSPRLPYQDEDVETLLAATGAKAAVVNGTPAA